MTSPSLLTFVTLDFLTFINLSRVMQIYEIIMVPSGTVIKNTVGDTVYRKTHLKMLFDAEIS